MKISKTALLMLWWSFIFLGLWLMLVSVATAEKELGMNPRNAVHHVQNVALISGNNRSILRKEGGGVLWIQADNFVISQTWNTVKNEIKNANSSSILWWIKNTISGWSANVILGWQMNEILGNYSTILWWSGNKIQWSSSTNSVILWWLDNKLQWNNSVAGWQNNTVVGNNSTALWENSSITWNNSVALWSGAKIKASNSFLWTDWKQSGELDENNVFAIVSKHWLVVNTGKAHSFAKLTIWGPLIVYNNGNSDNNLQCNSDTKWVLKVVNESSHKCFCSCDGLSRNSLNWQWKCVKACNPKIEPVCGTDVSKSCPDGGRCSYSGSCATGTVVEGTGAYFIDKDDMLHWSCETEDGWITGCVVALTSGGPVPVEPNLEECTIQYDANGWTPTPSAQTGTCGESVNLAPAPTKPWFTFVGWMSSQDGQTYIASTSYTLPASASTVTMTAQWDNSSYPCTWTVPSWDGYLFWSWTYTSWYTPTSWTYTSGNPWACEYTCDTSAYEWNGFECLQKSFTCGDVHWNCGWWVEASNQNSSDASKYIWDCGTTTGCYECKPGYDNDWNGNCVSSQIPKCSSEFWKCRSWEPSDQNNNQTWKCTLGGNTVSCDCNDYSYTVITCPQNYVLGNDGDCHLHYKVCATPLRCGANLSRYSPWCEYERQNVGWELPHRDTPGVQSCRGNTDYSIPGPYSNFPSVLENRVYWDSSSNIAVNGVGNMYYQMSAYEDGNSEEDVVCEAQVVDYRALLENCKWEFHKFTGSVYDYDMWYYMTDCPNHPEVNTISSCRTTKNWCHSDSLSRINGELTLHYCKVNTDVVAPCSDYYSDIDMIRFFLTQEDCETQHTKWLCKNGPSWEKCVHSVDSSLEQYRCTVWE